MTKIRHHNSQDDVNIKSDILFKGVNIILDLGNAQNNVSYMKNPFKNIILFWKKIV